MLNSFAVSAAVGLILGCLSGMGIGGGSLLILWLTHIANYPQQQARIINLLFFLPTAAVSSLLRLRKGTLHFSASWGACLPGAISALAFSLLSQRWNTELLQKAFGILILVIGIRELVAARKVVSR